MTVLPPLRILTVCTGNICRSPAMERLLAARLGPFAAVGSAGTAALVGEPVHPLMAALVVDAGASPAGFAARQLTAALLVESELILTATAAHRARVVDLAPSTVRRAFCLLEFARLLPPGEPAGAPHGADVADRLRRLVPLAAARRSIQRPPDPRDDDVPDPYSHGPEHYARAFTLIRGAVDRIASALLGETDPAPRSSRAAQPAPLTGHA